MSPWELLILCLRMNAIPHLSKKSLWLSMVTDVTVGHGRGTGRGTSGRRNVRF